MDGKRLRTTQIFTSLVPLMKEAGYHRDVQSMIIKFKNLKSDYYKCKRNNNKSGHEPEDYIYYDDMDQLLGHRPCTELEGFDSSSNTTNVEDLVPVENITIEWYDNVPDDDGAVPGSSNDSTSSQEEIQSSSSISELSTSGNNNQKKKKKGKVHELLDELKESVTKNEQKMAEDRAQFELFLEQQQKMLMEFSQTMIKGMKKILCTKNVGGTTAVLTQTEQYYAS